MPASTPGQRESSEQPADDRPSSSRRTAESFVRKADVTSPLGTLAHRVDLRDRTIDAVQRVLEAGRGSGEASTRTEKRIRRYAVARQELTTARYDAAAGWRSGVRSPSVISALRKLRAGVMSAHDHIAATPEGLLAEKRDDLRRYSEDLRMTRFAVTPSREAALDALLEAVVQGRPVLMLGPSGTGKTTLVHELSHRLGVELEVIPGNEVTAGQLWGTRGLDPQKGDVIRDGIVARAMIDGKLLLWDEANASDEAMEKFLKFKAYLTRRAGDLVRVPAEHPDLRRISPRFAFILTGNPKGQKHTTRAEFPPEVARELGEVRLEYLPEDELFDVCLAHLTDAEVVPLGLEELRTDGVLHNLVRLTHEIQNLYLGESAARGVAGAPTLRKLVIDPGMITAWLNGWAYARADRGESLASYIDRQLVMLANSEKYPAEDRALLAQTAARFHFLATPEAKDALRVPGLAATALSAFTPFAPALYTPDREVETSLRDAVAAHPYVERRLAQHFATALTNLATQTGRTTAELQSLLIGATLPERLQELQSLAAATPEELAEILSVVDASDASASVGATVPPPAPDRPVDLTRERWSIAELRTWLQTTLDCIGNTLESHLEGQSLDVSVAKYQAAYREGDFGFTLDPSRIELPVSAEFLKRLKEGFESGAINGVVIEAYPTEDEVRTIAGKGAGVLGAVGQVFGKPAVTPQNIAELLDATAVEFLARHFEKRGGTLYDKASRFAKWKTLRTAASNGEPLWQVFQRAATASGVNPSAWVKNGSRTTEYAQLHKAIHGALQPPTKLRDVTGKATITFTNVLQNVQSDAKILNADGVTAVEQGLGLTFIRLMQEKIDTLTPPEFLALTAACDPGDITTYPDQSGWEWLAGIDDTYAAIACSDSGGLSLGWDDPEDSRSNYRVRSVVR
jgi:AAA domain (dynein-related subfamily)